MLKSLNEELYNKIDVKKHVSHFRNKGNSFRISFFTYAYFKRKIIINNVNNAYIDFKNKDISQFRTWINENVNKTQLSINDQDLNDIFDKVLYYKMVEETLYELFPNKSLPS